MGKNINISVKNKKSKKWMKKKRKTKKKRKWIKNKEERKIEKRINENEKGEEKSAEMDKVLGRKREVMMTISFYNVPALMYTGI